MFNKNFYPTPKDLASKMFFKLENATYLTEFLEPSAGKGDILDYVKSVGNYNYNREDKRTFHAIEIEPELKEVEPEIAVEPQVESQPEIAERETSEIKLDIEPEISAEPKEKEQIGEPELDQNGAYYDANGNYVYPNKGYYDPQGNFHDLKGGWYEPDGTTYHEPEVENKEIVVKKKAGRPRKIVEGEPIKEKKPRGRPKKVETENTEGEKPKKRGRPKKAESG